MTEYNIANLKILIIESNSLTAKAIRTTLTELGVLELFTASNIDDAIAILKSENPDLILSDWSPQTNGIQLIHQIRDDHSKNNRFIPVIFLSAYSDVEQRKEAINAGINDYLIKPFSARRIYSHIKKTIEVPTFFLRSGKYFGPCRRHASKTYYTPPPYAGSERRVFNIPMEDENFSYRPIDK